jgi:nicotinamide mononucleotide transporter
VNLLEVLATLLGVANILLLVRRSIWNFPFGLVMVSLTGILVFEQRLYSDAVLQIFFFAAQLYGWWAWWKAGGADHAVAVERLTPPARIAWIAMIVLLSVVWGAGMRGYTNAALPWVDATLAVMSMAAQLLLARRCIENWVLWIIVDVGTIGMYLFKDLYWLAGLYIVFLVVSVAGLIEWARAARRQAQA